MDELLSIARMSRQVNAISTFWLIPFDPSGRSKGRIAHPHGGGDKKSIPRFRATFNKCWSFTAHTLDMGSRSRHDPPSLPRRLSKSKRLLAQATLQVSGSPPRTLLAWGRPGNPRETHTRY